MIKEFYPENVYDLIKVKQLFKSFDENDPIWEIEEIIYSDIWVTEKDNVDNRHVFQLQNVVESFVEGIWIPLVEIPQFIDCTKCNIRNEYVEPEHLIGKYICYKCKSGF